MTARKCDLIKIAGLIVSSLHWPRGKALLLKTLRTFRVHVVSQTIAFHDDLFKRQEPR